MGQGCAGGCVPPLRAGVPREQREPRHGPHGVLPRVEGARAGHDHRGGRPGGEPLVPRACGLPRIGQPHLGSVGHHAHQPRPLRGGEHLHRHRLTVGGHTGPPVLHAALGALRRQPCVGGSMDPRRVRIHGRVEVPRGLRARPAAEYGLVLGTEHTLHDGALEGLRPLQGRRGGGEAHQFVFRTQFAFPLCSHAESHRHRAGRGGQAPGGGAGEVQALQLRRILHPQHPDHRRRGQGRADHRPRRPTHLGHRRRALCFRETGCAAGQHLDSDHSINSQPSTLNSQL